jgi:hypothetical protein
MALRAWASVARLDKLKLIPQIAGVCSGGACFSLPAGDSPASPCGPPKAMKPPAMFFNRAVNVATCPPSGPSLAFLPLP